MTELKTLKELRSGLKEIIRIVRKNPLSLPQDLKFCEVIENYFKQEDAEAVKWVKEIKSSTGGEKWVDDPYCCLPCMVNWIKNFFNLTEEDLKDEK